MTSRDMKVIISGQSRYRGDRHADYPIGVEPARLDSRARHEVIDAARCVRRRYEERVFGVSLDS